MTASTPSGPPAPPADRPADGLRAWLRLPGAVGDAADPRCLVHAALALIVTLSGRMWLDDLFGPEGPGDRFRSLREEPPPAVDLDAPWAALPDVVRAIAEPIRVLLDPLADLLAIGGGNAAFLRSLLEIVLALFIWGLHGGAIARIAVVRASGAVEDVGAWTAGRFAASRIRSLLLPPLGMLAGAAVLLVPGAAVGPLLNGGPGTGVIAAGVLFGVPLLLAIPAALLLVALVSGWPLMVLTVVAEGEDGFEAVGRAVGYLRRAAWRYAAAGLVVGIAGAVGLVLAGLFARLVVRLACWSMAVGGPDRLLIGLVEGWPARGPLADEPAFGFWLGVVGLVLHAWIFSYFWTAAASVYLLIREAVDGTDPRAVYRPGEEAADFADLPKIGR